VGFKEMEYLHLPDGRVAYIGAGGVPMAVPVSCNQYVSPNLK
jgi:hypothetical protein